MGPRLWSLTGDTKDQSDSTLQGGALSSNMVSLQEFLKLRDNHIRNMDVYELYIEYLYEADKTICMYIWITATFLLNLNKWNLFLQGPVKLNSINSVHVLKKNSLMYILIHILNSYTLTLFTENGSTIKSQTYIKTVK